MVSIMRNGKKLIFISRFLYLMVCFVNTHASLFHAGKENSVLPVISVNRYAAAVNAGVHVNPTGAKRSLSPTPVVVRGNFDTPIYNSVKKTVSRIYYFPYQFSPQQCWALRVCVNSDSATADSPLLVAIRHSVSTMLMSVPLTFQDSKMQYSDVCRTLCPLAHFYPSIPDGPEEVNIELTSYSPNDVDFTLLVSNVTNFIIKTTQTVSANITVSQPTVFEYHMPDYIKSVLVHVSSSDEQCMVAAVQDIKCPFYDTERTAEYEGFHQTMTYQGGITVTRKAFPSGKVYIVMLLKPTDEECYSSYDGISDDTNSTTNSTKISTMKEVMVTVLLTTTDAHFYEAVFGTLGFYVFIYMLTFAICVFLFVRSHYEPAMQRPSVTEESQNQPTQQQRCCVISWLQRFRILRHHEDTELQAHGINNGAIEDKEVVRGKEFLFVSDLYRKTDKRLNQHASMYSCNLATVALFYGLPAIQLVLINQQIVNITGNQDLCFYNFLCSYKLWIFSDFNHFYSNIGYVMLGILFIALVWRRKTQSDRGSSDNAENTSTGVAHHFGLFYAMGFALVMEGILSAAYHVCPNQANYQFDTAFMYVISTLSMVKLYHSRHPDITAKSYTTWMVLAVVVLMGVIGVLHQFTFWIVFGLCHIFTTFFISTAVYYMWTFKLSIDRLQKGCDRLGKAYADKKIEYRGRLIIVAIGICCNLAFDLYGFIVRPEDFASYVLILFLVNFFLYALCYGSLKCLHGECIGCVPLLYLVMSFVVWVVAVAFFFLKHKASWGVTPAKSREINKLCIVGNFYDEHDIWHLLSSFALFFSFMGLLTFDDDRRNIPRDQIAVF